MASLDTRTLPHHFGVPRQSMSERPITYRRAAPSDFESLQSAHYEMFPVDYEESFFQRVATGQDGLQNLMAVNRDSQGNEAIIGFITARAFRLYECDPVDRALLGLGHRLLDHDTVFYILTLGVSPPFRKRGIGAKLVQWVIQHAQETCCRAIYLHVIDYNHAAMALYRREHFQQVACRDNFYHITSGRQPEPSKEVYHAYLYAHVMDTTIHHTPLNMLLLAVTPLRGVFDFVHSCLPWGTPRGTYFGSRELPSLPASRAKDGGGSLLDSGCSSTANAPPWLLSLFSRQRNRRQQ